MKDSPTIPYISIRPGYSTFYSVPIDRRGRRKPSERQLQALGRNRHNGIISHKAARRVGTAVDWLLYLSKDKKYYNTRLKRHYYFRLNFITLTLAAPQRHSDQVIKSQLLHQFLVEIERDYGVKRYVWRAEAQANDNIHFHLITDKYIHYSVLRKMWNRIQNKLGYVDDYRRNQLDWHKGGFKPRPELYKVWPLVKQKKAYEQGLKGNWSSPNSVDVHSVRRVRKLSAYLVKYMTKNPNTCKMAGVCNVDKPVDYSKVVFSSLKFVKLPPKPPRGIAGKLWGLSHSLSRLKSCVIPICSEIRAELSVLLRRFRGLIRKYDYHSCLWVGLKQWLVGSGTLLHTKLKAYVVSCLQPPPKIVNRPQCLTVVPVAKRSVSDVVQLVLDLPLRCVSSENGVYSV